MVCAFTAQEDGENQKKKWLTNRILWIFTCICASLIILTFLLHWVCYLEFWCEPVVVIWLMFNKTVTNESQWVMAKGGFQFVNLMLLFPFRFFAQLCYLSSSYGNLHRLESSSSLEQSEQKVPVVKCSERTELVVFIFLFDSESISLFAWRLCCCYDPAPTEITLSLLIFLWMMGQTIMKRASFVLKQVINNHLHQLTVWINLSVWNYCNLTHYGLVK